MAMDCDFALRSVHEAGSQEQFMSDPDAFTKLGHFTAHDELKVYDLVDPEKNGGLNQEGKVIVITGAGRGIGRSVATMFAKAKVKGVGICARTLSELEETEKEARKINPQIMVYSQKVDVSLESDVKSFFENASAKLGGIDVAVSNAGANSLFTPVEHTDVDTWWYEQTVNLKGSFLVAKYFLQSLKGNQGTLVNMSSLDAIRTAPGQSSYGISKLATLRLMETLHIEAPNLRCFSLHPGAVDTKMVRSNVEKLGISLTLNWTDPELTGGVILWLSTPRAEFLRGRLVFVNWRVDELEAMKEKIVKENLLKTAFNAKLGL